MLRCTFIFRIRGCPPSLPPSLPRAGCACAAEQPPSRCRRGGRLVHLPERSVPGGRASASVTSVHRWSWQVSGTELAAATTAPAVPVVRSQMAGGGGGVAVGRGSAHTWRPAAVDGPRRGRPGSAVPGGHAQGGLGTDPAGCGWRWNLVKTGRLRPSPTAPRCHRTGRWKARAGVRLVVGKGQRKQKRGPRLGSGHRVRRQAPLPPVGPGSLLPFLGLSFPAGKKEGSISELADFCLAPCAHTAGPRYASAEWMNEGCHPLWGQLFGTVLPTS